MNQGFENFQRDFAQALVSADPEARPEGLEGKDRERFKVYRNNYFAGIRDQLADIYPVSARLLGKAAFQKAALGFAANNPPKARTFAALGKGFPEFLEAVNSRVADLARLELAVHRALFAADAAPLNPKALTKMGAWILQTRFKPHPVTSLLELAYPVLEIWQAGGRGRPAKPQRKTTFVLITRPIFEVKALPLDAGEAAFAKALLARKTCQEAAAKAENVEKKFDTEKAFEKLLLAGAFA